ncbi:MAG: CopG family transcriptional regulator [Bacillota bacterium]
MSDTQMIHLRLPKHLIAALDREAGGRPRSAVVAEALEEYLRRRRLVYTIRQHAGTLSAEEQVVWGSSEAVDAWARGKRAEWESGRGKPS